MDRQAEILEAKSLIRKIRKEANLTKEESRILSSKLCQRGYDFTKLDEGIMTKLREACKRLDLTVRIDGKECNLNV